MPFPTRLLSCFVSKGKLPAEQHLPRPLEVARDRLVAITRRMAALQAIDATVRFWPLHALAAGCHCGRCTHSLLAATVAVARTRCWLPLWPLHALAAGCHCGRCTHSLLVATLAAARTRCWLPLWPLHALAAGCHFGRCTHSLLVATLAT
jgi:hypothetical protein